MFRTLSKIYDGAFSKNSPWFLAADYFCKRRSDLFEKILNTSEIQKHVANDVASAPLLPVATQWMSFLMPQTLDKEWSFPLKISLVNMTKSAICRFDHIYWRNP